MLRSHRLSRTRPAVVAVALAASVMLLSGCTGDAAEPDKTTAPPTASETPDSSSSPVPTETAEPAVPFAIECDALLTPDQVYAFNPNFGTAPDFEPSGEHMASVVDEAGTACGWMNQTSGEIIEVGVATPPPAALLAHQSDAAMESTPVPTYGTPPTLEGYFTQAAGSGEVQVFSGPYWIVIRSAALFEPGDAGQLVADVLANLPAA
ncbi:iron ABC transporter ATP-binding protein [Agromyces sp. CCNWLW203]|uniref:iron ABC transporter ATP-binding protein n=1 Tax=Agromyces sp. CCNWLW203 TaxID=3112842 RepID=UPI002F96D9E5